MTSTNRLFNWNTISNFNELDKNVQMHLMNVYSTMSFGFLACALASYAMAFVPFLTNWSASIILLSGIASIFSTLYIAFTPHSNENLYKRLGAFTFSALSFGFGLGPLIRYTAIVNPEILLTALLSTAFIFVCFTLAALFSKKRSFIYMGGLLMSLTSTLILMGLVNIFLRVETLFLAQTYCGLAVFCLYILYDTQVICERARSGDKDFIWHALDLLIDFVQIFRHILVILNNKEARRNRNNRD